MFNTKKWKTGFLAVFFTTGSHLAHSNDKNNIPLTQPTDSRPFVYLNSPRNGIYDPTGSLDSDRLMKINHYFFSLTDFKAEYFLRLLDKSKQNGREILLTIEPRSWEKRKNVGNTPVSIYKNIMKGNQDGKIREICRTVGKSNIPITIRWAQEMEDPNGPYIWNSWSAADYKTVYQKFVSLCRNYTKNVQYMWSPKGSIGKHDAFYPGDEFVDVIGVTLFGFQDYDKKYFNRNRGFVETFSSTYNAVQGYGKPIWVAEFAYNGDAKYVASWQEESLLRHREFPNLSAVVYFNLPEETAWPDGWKPDWRIGNNITGQ